ncbi:hypothetical protein RB195_024014 [Necator americanus]|uniref:Uncharacterized protein n=1 Tax=Necator americanus TaxID=51031 RepID=A0ABR1ELM3_NECAM
MRGKRHRTVSCEKTEASKMPFNQKDRRYHGMARTIADVKDNLKDRAATIVPPTTTRPARQRQPPLRLQPDPKMKTGSYSPAQCTQQCLIQLPDLDLVSEQVRGQINHLHNSSKDTTGAAERNNSWHDIFPQILDVAPTLDVFSLKSAHGLLEHSRKARNWTSEKKRCNKAEEMMMERKIVPKKLKPLDGEALAFVKLRYKDIAKYILAGVLTGRWIVQRNQCSSSRASTQTSTTKPRSTNSNKRRCGGR